MIKAINDFQKNIDRVYHLGGLQSAIAKLTTNAVDTSDILRSQIVLGVSALDCYIHEVTILGMIEIFEGKRIQTPAFEKFNIPINLVLIHSSSSGSKWFEAEIRERLSFQTFQQPDKIADAIRLISNKTLWNQVSSELKNSEKDIKDRLKLIIDRRNKIAHEADLAPGVPASYWPIDEKITSSTLSFISDLCNAINNVVTS